MKRLLKWKTSSKRQNWFFLQWRRTQGISVIDFLIVSNSRTKKRPTNQDIININAAIEQLMKQNNNVNNAPDPAQNPFVFLWLANCVIYSVVIAFLVLKGWEKSEEQNKSNEEEPWWKDEGKIWSTGRWNKEEHFNRRGRNRKTRSQSKTHQ